MNAARMPRGNWPYCDGDCQHQRRSCTHPHVCPGPGLTEQEVDARLAHFYPLPLDPHPWALPRRVQHRLMGALVGAVVVAIISLLAGCGGGDDTAAVDERVAAICQGLTVHIPGDPLQSDALSMLWRDQCIRAGGVVPPAPTPADAGPPAPTLCQADPQVCR